MAKSEEKSIPVKLNVAAYMFGEIEIMKENSLYVKRAMARRRLSIISVMSLAYPVKEIAKWRGGRSMKLKWRENNLCWRNEAAISWRKRPGEECLAISLSASLKISAENQKQHIF